MIITKENLSENVEKITECGCWVWLHRVSKKGYAEFDINNTRILVHRYVYELYKGDIPFGLVIDHLCRVRCCVNPDHLEAVTSRENTLRGITVASSNASKTHCPNGHEYSGDNLRMEELRSTGLGRRCKMCANARSKKQRDTARKLKEAS